MPCIRKAGALDGLGRLYAAIAAVEEDALMIINAIGARAFVDERQAIALRAERGVALDEIVLRHAEVAGHGPDLDVTDDDQTRPAAAVRAALALVVDFVRHGAGANETRKECFTSVNLQADLKKEVL